MTKRIAIMGSGANGSAIGADLVRAGLDVKLIDQWPAHVEAMRADGVTIKMPDETIHADVDAYHLCDIATFTEPFDVVLMLFKAYDTRWAAELIKPHLAEDGLLVGVQNGMTYETISDVVGPERTLPCVIELAGELEGPGVVIRRSPPDNGSWFALGSIDPATDGREEEIAELLRHVGAVEIVPDILSAKWMKLVVNTMCLGPMAMLGLTQQEAAKLPGMRDLAVRIGTEALAAGQTRGHKIEPIFGLKPEDVADTNRLLEKLLDKLFGDIGPKARDCVLQDHLKGRYSEVDQINGLVVQDARERGASATANAVIVEITGRIRAGELQPSPNNLELALEMLG